MWLSVSLISNLWTFFLASGMVSGKTAESIKWASYLNQAEPIESNLATIWSGEATNNHTVWKLKIGSLMPSPPNLP